jgi:hypothetical protein
MCFAQSTFFRALRSPKSEKLKSPKRRCVIVCRDFDRDFDNESARRRKLWLPPVGGAAVDNRISARRIAAVHRDALVAESDSLDASSSEFHIVSRAKASALRAFLAFEIDGTKRAPGFSSRRTIDEKIY